MTRQNTKWKWGPTQQKAFDEYKALLVSSDVLVHYNTELPIILSSDASPYGIGSVLSHRLPDGSDKHIAYASRSLYATEKKYTQLEKEALSFVFGNSKFHMYLYGRDFVLQTDHLPLIRLLKEGRAISAMTSARIQRRALTLNNYQYHLEYRPGSSICHADGLSRLPLPDTPERVPVPEEVVLILTTINDTSDELPRIVRTPPPTSGNSDETHTHTHTHTRTRTRARAPAHPRTRASAHPRTRAPAHDQIFRHL